MILFGAGPNLGVAAGYYYDCATQRPNLRCHPPLQVFYHLDDLDDALAYALGAGTLFDITSTSDYVQTILGTPGDCVL